jgi:hypothetical protein
MDPVCADLPADIDTAIGHAFDELFEEVKVVAPLL